MQGIGCRHEAHIGSTRKGCQNLGRQTSSKARVPTILWLRPWNRQPGLGSDIWANMPPLARYISKLPLHRPKLSSLGGIQHFEEMLSRHSLAWILSLGLSAGSPENSLAYPTDRGLPTCECSLSFRATPAVLLWCSGWHDTRRMYLW
jgi:hypothetical protein